MVGAENMPALTALRLLTIDELLDGELFDEEPDQKENLRHRVIQYLTNDLDGMAMVSEAFNYDECLDLIKAMSSDQDGDEEAQADFWPIILAIFG